MKHLHLTLLPANLLTSLHVLPHSPVFFKTVLFQGLLRCSSPPGALRIAMQCFSCFRWIYFPSSERAKDRMLLDRRGMRKKFLLENLKSRSFNTGQNTKKLYSCWAVHAVYRVGT
jgi:hypothetical protein